MRCSEQLASHSLLPPRRPTNFLISALTKPWKGEENQMIFGPVGAKRSQFGNREQAMGSVSGSLVRGHDFAQFVYATRLADELIFNIVPALEGEGLKLVLPDGQYKEMQCLEVKEIGVASFSCAIQVAIEERKVTS